MHKYIYLYILLTTPLVSLFKEIELFWKLVLNEETISQLEISSREGLERAWESWESIRIMLRTLLKKEELYCTKLLSRYFAATIPKTLMRNNTGNTNTKYPPNRTRNKYATSEGNYECMHHKEQCGRLTQSKRACKALPRGANGDFN